MKIISLPWYDLPSSQDVLDNFWLVLREELLAVGFDELPTCLNRSIPIIRQWNNSDLLISQCQQPFVSDLSLHLCFR
ncbi:MAG: hypothetical protein ABGY96_11540 [bacterium]|nr:hypothetical protein [Gammaproteobacteria bacterium]